MDLAELFKIAAEASDRVIMVALFVLALRYLFLRTEKQSGRIEELFKESNRAHLETARVVERNTEVFERVLVKLDH